MSEIREVAGRFEAKFPDSDQQDKFTNKIKTGVKRSVGLERNERRKDHGTKANKSREHQGKRDDEHVTNSYREEKRKLNLADELDQKIEEVKIENSSFDNEEGLSEYKRLKQNGGGVALVDDETTFSDGSKMGIDNMAEELAPEPSNIKAETESLRQEKRFYRDWGKMRKEDNR